MTIIKGRATPNCKNFDGHRLPLQIRAADTAAATRGTPNVSCIRRNRAGGAQNQKEEGGSKKSNAAVRVCLTFSCLAVARSGGRGSLRLLADDRYPVADDAVLASSRAVHGQDLRTRVVCRSILWLGSP